VSSLFPYANIVAVILIFIVGFCGHWHGQLVSVLNWEYATKLGLQEKKLLPECRVYEHAIAVAGSTVSPRSGCSSMLTGAINWHGYRDPF
jgi:hypothetical protein